MDSWAVRLTWFDCNGGCNPMVQPQHLHIVPFIILIIVTIILLLLLLLLLLLFEKVILVLIQS